MEVKLSYFGQDGKLRATGRLATNSSDYNNDLLETVLRRSRLYNGLPGIHGLANCYHILIEPAGLEPMLVPAQPREKGERRRAMLNSTTTRAGVAPASTWEFVDDD